MQYDGILYTAVTACKLICKKKSRNRYCCLLINKCIVPYIFVKYYKIIAYLSKPQLLSCKLFHLRCICKLNRVCIRQIINYIGIQECFLRIIKLVIVAEIHEYNFWQQPVIAGIYTVHIGLIQSCYSQLAQYTCLIYTKISASPHLVTDKMFTQDCKNIIASIPVIQSLEYS